VKHKKRVGRDQEEPESLDPGERVLQIKRGKRREDEQRDHFLNGLELDGMRA
jgi:hypothetical protein